MTPGLGSEPMLFSREELEIIEVCILTCLMNKVFDEDTTKDTVILLHTIRTLLHKDDEEVADAVAEAIRTKYHAAEEQS